MKKKYVMPKIEMELVETESLLNITSLKGEAEAETVGFSREGGSFWDDAE